MRLSTFMLWATILIGYLALSDIGGPPAPASAFFNAVMGFFWWNWSFKGRKA